MFQIRNSNGAKLALILALIAGVMYAGIGIGNPTTALAWEQNAYGWAGGDQIYDQGQHFDADPYGNHVGFGDHSWGSVNLWGGAASGEDDPANYQGEVYQEQGVAFGQDVSGGHMFHERGSYQASGVLVYTEPGQAADASAGGEVDTDFRLTLDRGAWGSGAMMTSHGVDNLDLSGYANAGGQSSGNASAYYDSEAFQESGFHRETAFDGGGMFQETYSAQHGGVHMEVGD